MNGTEQRKHRTAVAEVEKNMVNALDAHAERMDVLEQNLDEADRNVAWLRAAIDEEIETRGRADRRQCDAADSSKDALFAAIRELRDRDFWSRLNWLFTGR